MKYDDKTKRFCENLGAVQFQKLVFVVERIKYFIIRNVFPNITKYYNKMCDKKRDALLNRCKDDAQMNNIKNYYNYEKLKFKREINNEQNRNYHLDSLNPGEIINFLNINKDIHIRGLKSNFVIAFVLIVFSLVFKNPFPILSLCILVFEGIGAIINFECINLQNYNLCRFSSEKAQEILEKSRNRKMDKMEKQYSEGIKVISKTFNESLDVPDLNDVLSNIHSREEVNQLLNYARVELDKKRKNENKKLRKGRR